MLTPVGFDVMSQRIDFTSSADDISVYRTSKNVNEVSKPRINHIGYICVSEYRLLELNMTIVLFTSVVPGSWMEIQHHFILVNYVVFKRVNLFSPVLPSG